jgi:rfaE bifunctional protein nucleotidyltransferase chain/domain
VSIIFTNGCFDILHRGHIELLKYCAEIGDRVIVGLNDDESVRRIKGDNRPVNPELDRKFVLESCRYVDQVMLFTEDTPYELIKKVQPDVIVKGGDYSVEQVVGRDLCEVRIFGYRDGYSTSETIESITNRR